MKLTREQKTMAVRIVLTVLILAAAALIFREEEGGAGRAAFYVAAYLIIGYDILFRGVYRLAGRHVFDENFLMIVASLGAFALMDFGEGVAVLLLYQIGELFEDVAISRSQENIRTIIGGEDCAAHGHNHAHAHHACEGLGHDHAEHGHKPGASRSEQFISRFARIYTPVICLGALIVGAGVPLVRMAGGLDPHWHDWIYRALTFLVISCPCAMVISIPLSFSAGIGAAGREGIYVRDSVALEKLAKGAVQEEGAVAVRDGQELSGKMLARAQAIAGRTMRIVRENIWMSIGIKVICLILGALGYAPLWLAIFADDGVMILAVLNAMRAMVRPAAV